MGLYLGYHYLDPLFSQQGLFVLSDELKMEPDVIEYAARGHGYVQIADIITAGH